MNKKVEEIKDKYSPGKTLAVDSMENIDIIGEMANEIHFLISEIEELEDRLYEYGEHDSN